MSSKLKRKIDELNVQNVNESFVQVSCNYCVEEYIQLRVSPPKYGTPLPALTDTKRDAGEFLPLWQQEVCLINCLYKPIYAPFHLGAR